MRTIPAVDSAPNSFPVAGTVLTTQTFVHVRWPWLAFLAAQLAASLGFFAATVAATSAGGTPVMKSSALAALFALRRGGGGQEEEERIISTPSGRDCDVGLRVGEPDARLGQTSGPVGAFGTAARGTVRRFNDADGVKRMASVARAKMHYRALVLSRNGPGSVYVSDDKSSPTPPMTK